MSVSFHLLSHPLPPHHESRRILDPRIVTLSPTFNLRPPTQLPISRCILSARPHFPARRFLSLGFSSHAAANGGAESSDAGADDGSAMPSQLRHLMKEVPEPPVLWPWLIALFFLIYSWRMVLWELSNWKKLAMAAAGFFGYIVKSVAIRALSFVWSIYASIVASAPVPELSALIILTSTILAIAEATVPDSVKSQPYILSFGGLIGYLAMEGVILDPLFWLLLSGLYCYNRFVKKKDNVSAALPMAAVVTAVGGLWLRLLAITSFLALAIVQHSKSSQGNPEVVASSNTRRLPLPLLFCALAIGIRVAAQWIRYRHLTWKSL